MTTNQPRSFGSRLWWIIRTVLLIFIVLALATAVLGGLGYAGYWGVQEIQRSDNSLLMRIEANEQNLNSLRDLVNAEFEQGNPEQQIQINQLQNEVEALTTQLEAFQTVQDEDTAVQTDQIDTLEASLATAVAQNGTLAGELETVQSALVALQSDLNGTGSRIDELGGDLDTLRLRLTDLDDSLAGLTTDVTAARDAEASELQQSLIQLQLWGLLTNARLALVDGDIDVAETAVAQAIPLASSLTAELESTEAQALVRLQTRLTLAADGFATDLNMVAQDLDAASNELSLLILGLPPEAEEAEVEEVTPTETATSTPLSAGVDETETPASPTEEPTETATPEPAGTPTPSPSPTATP